MPLPYRDLLVHEGDMTSRLEQFHGGPICVDKLHSSSDGRAYFREVALRRETDKEAVEYGAAHGALAMTTPGDTSMVSISEVEKIKGGGGARVVR